MAAKSMLETYNIEVRQHALCMASCSSQIDAASSVDHPDHSVASEDMKTLLPAATLLDPGPLWLCSACMV